MRTLLILDIASLSMEEVAQLRDRVAGSTLSIIDLTPNGAAEDLAPAFNPYTSVDRSDLGQAIKTADEVLVIASNSIETLKFIDENKETLVEAKAQVLDFGGEEAQQNAEISTLKKKLSDLTSQVSELAQELASVKMINQAILGCMPEEQRQQIEATAAHMQATMDQTMSLMRQFVEYSAKLTAPVSIETAMSEFGETLGLGTTFADMVLGMLENVYTGKDFNSYVNTPVSPYDLATDTDLRKAMMVSYSSVVSSINRQA